jgi:hypothetical protein
MRSNLIREAHGRASAGRVLIPRAANVRDAGHAAMAKAPLRKKVRRVVRIKVLVQTDR